MIAAWIMTALIFAVAAIVCAIWLLALAWCVGVVIEEVRPLFGLRSRRDRAREIETELGSDQGSETTYSTLHPDTVARLRRQGR